jgi:hypothetical protein
MSYLSTGASDIPGVPSETPGSASDSLQWKKDSINRVGCWNATKGAWVGDQYCAFKVGKKPEAKQSIGNKIVQGFELASLIRGSGQQTGAPSGSSNLPMYLALGGGALLLVIALKKKKATP